MDVNFDDLLSRLNFSDPINGEDLLKWILGEVDPIIFSNNIRDNMINPLLDQITNLYEKIGNVAKETANDKSAVKRFSEPLGLTLIHKEFSKDRTKIRKLISPVIDKLGKLYETVGKNLDTNIKQRSQAMADPLGILDVRKDYKTKIHSVLGKVFNNLKSKNVEEAADKVLPESSKNAESSKGLEQKSLIDKNTVTLSDESIAAISQIGKSVSSKTLEGLKGFLKNSKSGEIPSASFDKDSKSGGLWAALSGILLTGGLAITAVAVFWKDHIKPWLQEKLGTSFDFVDKFKGILEGISKWFVLGGIGAGGMALKIGGHIFETAGQIGEKMIEGVFKTILGEGAEKGLGVGAIKILSGSTIKKILGKSLGGFGKAALKGIPIIGSLISLGFAIDNFMNGNYVQGSLDLLNGAVGLIPGIGIPLSLGVSALQIFLEAKTLSSEGSEKNSTQAKLLATGIGGIFKSLWSVLKKAPIFEWMVGLGEGVYKLSTGDFKGGLNRLLDVPMIGSIFAPISALFDNIEYDNSGKISGIDMKGFYKDVKTKMLKSFLSIVPTAFGMRYKLAELLGVGEEYKQDEWETNNADSALINQKVLKGAKTTPYSENTVSEKEEIIKALEKQIFDTKKLLEDNEKRSFELLNFAGKDMKRSELEQDLGYLRSQLEQNKKLLEVERNKSPKEKSANDLFSPASNTLSLGSKTLYDPVTNTNTTLAPDDNVLAYKTDGVFDKTLTDIKNVVVTVGKKISELSQVISTQSPSMNSVSVSNTSTSGGGDITMSGKRDPIFDARTDYWRRYPNERAFI